MSHAQRTVLETRTVSWQGMIVKWRRIRLADGTITETRELSDRDAYRLVAAEKELQRIKGGRNV